MPELNKYKPGTAFSGVIGRTFDVSEPAWPEPVRSRESGPNVLFIILCSGTIHSMTVDRSGELMRGPRAEMRAIMARQ